MKNKILLVIVLCLSLGLAPFRPEPHVWQKLKWLSNGGDGMGMIDYFDLLLHGTPWILLLILIIQYFLPKKA